jgi:hypothetical protein
LDASFETKPERKNEVIWLEDRILAKTATVRAFGIIGDTQKDDTWATFLPRAKKISIP